MTDEELNTLNTLRESVRRRRQAIGANLEAEYYLSSAEWNIYKTLLVKEIQQYMRNQPPDDGGPPY